VSDGSPPDEAYSRVTNPERFRPLHAFADAVVGALLQGYEIESVQHGVEITHLDAVRPVERSIRITPAGGGAPVTIAWTDFPGIYLVIDDRIAEPFPHCGCDACNDDPYGLFEEFHRHLWAVVNGGFQEWIADGHRFHGTDMWWSGDGAASLDAVPTWRSDWKAWRRISHW
jgi:hypothetical protein